MTVVSQLAFGNFIKFEQDGISNLSHEHSINCYSFIGKFFCKGNYFKSSRNTPI